MQETNFATYEQMRGSLGSILLLWAAIEKQLRKEVAQRGGEALPEYANYARNLKARRKAVSAAQPASSLARPLASILCDQLEEPRAVRNGVCHGLTGITGQHGKNPVSLFWNINGVKGSIAWDELQVSLHWLSRVPHAISIISGSSPDKAGSRMVDTPENCQWWLDEFGLDLACRSIALSESR